MISRLLISDTLIAENSAGPTVEGIGVKIGIMPVSTPLYLVHNSLTFSHFIVSVKSNHVLQIASTVFGGLSDILKNKNADYEF